MRSYCFSDLHEGLEAAFELDFVPQHLLDFAMLSGDTNPLHTDPTYARAQGFKDCVAHGMLHSAYYSRLVGMHLPGKYALFQGCKVAFKNPLYAPATLRVWGKITHCNESFKTIEISAGIDALTGGGGGGELCVSRAKLQVGLLI
ncbi:MaoC family dehydratase [Helicobacter cynogastricus]|uniref:MaoC family dehydratase n=1 Tax=Helicobacter cynogastricus TaxID=329937 RepID=UPI000CF0C7D2|nr:MaoC/PaaZ C-terminal domain-containing protein [Helicobacter cynogastricus]